jgi:nicotinamidase-related amidase
MNRSHSSLYGNVPDKSQVALLLIDVINDLDFPGRGDMVQHALRMAKRLARVKARAQEHGCAIIYVNDNFGRWRSDFRQQVRHCLEDDVPGKPIAELLRPDDDDYFVLKPAHSGFYSTSLELLLKHLGAQTLIVTGIATNICVLFTANDAYLRGYKLYVPRDCVAANTTALTKTSLSQMKSVLKAHIAASTSLPWGKWHAANVEANGKAK